MKHHLKKSFTLLELIIAIVLMGFVILGFAHIELFSRYHLLTANRRVKLQNEVSYVLEHMTKQISRAIGNTIISGQEPVNITSIGTDPVIAFCVDSNPVDGDGQRTAADQWGAYRLNNNTQMRYCANYTTGTGACNPSWGTLSQRINVFIPSIVDNAISITLSGCWNPATQCGTLDNPLVNMTTYIKMPSVSTH